MQYQHPDSEFLASVDAAPAFTSSHGTDEDIRAKLKPLSTTDWKLEGNKLTCMTDMGPLVQRIPTDKILIGIDNNNLPVFKTIEV